MEEGSTAELCRVLDERVIPPYLRTHHMQEVELDEAKVKAAIKAQKKRKSKADVEAEGCGEPSTETAPKRSRRVAPLSLPWQTDRQTEKRAA